MQHLKEQETVTKFEHTKFKSRDIPKSMQHLIKPNQSSNLEINILFQICSTQIELGFS